MKKTFFVALLTLPIVLVGCGEAPAGNDQVASSTSLTSLSTMVKYVKFSTYCGASTKSKDISGDIEIASEYEGVPVTFVDDFFGCHILVEAKRSSNICDVFRWYCGNIIKQYL